MSEQTKKNAQDTEYYLRHAESYVKNAEKSAQGTGDKKLVEKVTKINQTITETRKELNEKLNGG